jgi:hypothetical protein
LASLGGRVDRDLTADLAARRVEDLGAHGLVVKAVFAQIADKRVPDDDEAAAGQRRDIGDFEVAVDGGLNLELGPHRGAGGAEDLAAQGIEAGRVILSPDEDEPARGEADHVGSGAQILDRRVKREGSADLLTGRVE